jgi:diguanylate cyclase (GGDEF)-like protein
LTTLQKLPIVLHYITDEAMTKECASTLKEHFKTVEIMAYEEISEKTAPNGCDAIIADIVADEEKEISLIKHLHSLYPDTPLFLKVDFEHPLHLNETIGMGVTQYLSKDTQPENIAETVRDYFHTQIRNFYKMEISDDGKVLSLSESFAQLLGRDISPSTHLPLENVMESLDGRDNLDHVRNAFEQNETIYGLFKRDGEEPLAMGGNIATKSERDGIDIWLTEWFPMECLERSAMYKKERLRRDIHLKSLMKLHATIGRELFLSASTHLFLQGVMEKLQKIDGNMSSFYFAQRTERLEGGISPTSFRKSLAPILEKTIDLRDKENERLYMPLYLCARHQETVFIDDISHLPPSPLKSTLLGNGFTTMVAIPMKVGEYRSAEGIMALLFKERHRYDKEEIRMWKDITTTIAIGLEAIKARQERDMLIEKLDKIAHTDNLTGALNRRRGVEILEHEISRSKRYGSTFSVIFLDIDHFKKINDAYGHSMGDTVLVQTVRTIETSLRTTDSIIRWGGEEFLIVLPETRLNDAIFLARKLRERIEHRQADIPLPITASFGVAQWQPDMSFDDIIARSDMKMYEAKRLGRNRIAY